LEKSLETLVESLLYEGYALYPYTPTATKNSTPTPFGIVYPPAYAEGNSATFDHLRVDCVLHVAEGAEVKGTVRFLQTAGERHEGEARLLEIPPASLSDLAGGGVGEEFAFDGEQPVEGRFRLRADDLGDGLARVRMCVHNSTPVENGAQMKRGDALKASLISTHVVIETSAGEFASPAGHPQLSPHSLGNLFDNTEIEEALILHVKALSDSEREEIEKQDPAVREMISKADETTDEELMRLHGLMRPSDGVINPEGPGTLREPDPAFAGMTDPGPPPEPGHPNPGEPEMDVLRGTIRKGGKVILHPGDSSRDPMDGMLTGRTATVERIYRDMDDEIHVGVTVDGDASQDLFRETGRYIFFKGDEVEPA